MPRQTQYAPIESRRPDDPHREGSSEAKKIEKGTDFAEIGPFSNKMICLIESARMNQKRPYKALKGLIRL